jgi:hypothetical protein
MKRQYSPSALNVFTKHCPRALDFYQDYQRGFGELYAVGTAYHYIMEKIAQAQDVPFCGADSKEMQKIISDCRLELIARGKPNDPQGQPLPPQQVIEAAQLARQTLEKYAPPEGSKTVEGGIAFDANWQIVNWSDPSARFRLVLDLAFFEDVQTEEDSYRCLVVRDYKTSWQVDASEVESIQMRAQAYAMYLTYKDTALCPATIRCEVLDVRRQWIHSKEYSIAEIADFDEIKAQLTELMDAADAAVIGDRRKARTGANCAGCAYVLRCTDAAAVIYAERMEEDPREWAEQLAVHQGRAKQLKAVLDEYVKEHGPVDTETGQYGPKVTARRVPDLDKSKELYNEWTRHGGEAGGFVTAIGGVGSSGVESVLKVLMPSAKRSEIKESADNYLTTKQSNTTGWLKEAEE